MTVAAEASIERLDIGQAIQDVLNVLVRNIGPFALLGVLLAGVPAALVAVGRLLGTVDGGYTILVILGGAVSLVTRPILAGAVIFQAVRTLDGNPASLGEYLAAGRRRWGTMLGLTIWSGLLIGVGFIFLIVPGIYLALRWAVAGPAVVFGGRGIQDSMDLSAKVTTGRRWAMLLLYVIVFVALVVFATVLNFAEEGLAAASSKVLATALINPLTNVCFDVIFPVLAAVLYRRLRGDATGVSAAALDEVFA